MKVSNIIDRVTLLYNDMDYVRLSKHQYLEFLDDAINTLITMRPDVWVKTEVVKLQPGIRQTLPDEAYSLIDIYCNATKEEDGTFTYGEPIFQVERRDLDYFSDWRRAEASDVIYEFIYDRKTPRQFLVNPPVAKDKDVYIEMAYSAPYVSFADMQEDVAMQQDLELVGNYRGPLVDYMLYLAYSTDSTSSNDRQIAQQYMQSFYQALGQEYNASVIAMPKIDELPTNIGEAQPTND